MKLYIKKLFCEEKTTTKVSIIAVSYITTKCYLIFSKKIRELKILFLFFTKTLVSKPELDYRVFLTLQFITVIDFCFTYKHSL